MERCALCESCFSFVHGADSSSAHGADFSSVHGADCKWSS